MIARQSVWTDPEVKELTAKFIPVVAQRLTDLIVADPTDHNAVIIESVFDTGSCTNPDGSTATAHDKIIAVYGTPYEPGQIVALKILDVEPTNAAAGPVVRPFEQDAGELGAV